MQKGIGYMMFQWVAQFALMLVTAAIDKQKIHVQKFVFY